MPQKEELNIINLSGGKDSTAVLLLALESVNRETIRPVFCDTGNEHPLTYKYIDYLEEKLGIAVARIRADFTRRFAGKLKFILEKWPQQTPPVPQEIIDRASAILSKGPTGNPFLDLCLWKGMFPATRSRFCTQELKVLPMLEQIILPALKEGKCVVSWVGVRRDESKTRAALAFRELEDAGNEVYRPILDWTAEKVFAFAAERGVEPNPLYKLGMGRVGCMPCIMVRKAELREIARRFPDEIARIREWEALVSQASKSGISTLFATADNHGVGIDSEVRWSRTSYGGKQLEFEYYDDEPAGCSSIYGLCE